MHVQKLIVLIFMCMFYVVNCKFVFVSVKCCVYQYINSDTFHYPAQKDLTQAVICIMKTVNVMPFIRCYYRSH